MCLLRTALAEPFGDGNLMQLHTYLALRFLFTPVLVQAAPSLGDISAFSSESPAVEKFAPFYHDDLCLLQGAHPLAST